MKYDKQNGFGVVEVIVVAVTIALVFFGIWRVYEANQNLRKASNNQNQAQTDPNSGYVVIKEWNVRFKPVEGLTGVQYFKPAGIPSDAITFTTTALANKEPNCSKTKGGPLLGLLQRSRDPESVGPNGNVLAHIGEYYFRFMGPQAMCGSMINRDLESQTLSRIVTSIKSLEAAR